MYFAWAMIGFNIHGVMMTRSNDDAKLHVILWVRGIRGVCMLVNLEVKMKCLTCQNEADHERVYCDECQVVKDDLLLEANVKLKRFCGQCGRAAIFQRMNDRVIRCTFCNDRHEVGFRMA